MNPRGPEPMRLLDETGPGQDLRRALQDVRGREPDAPWKAALAASLGITAGPPGSGAAGAPSGSSALPHLASAAGWGVLAAAMIGGAVIASPTPVVRPARPVAPSSVWEPVRAMVHASDRDTAAPQDLEPVRESVAPAAREPKVASSGPAQPSESELLARAHRALDRDPTEALRWLREHERLYPRGTFAQEREVLMIEAASRAGRSSEAKARADQFLKKNPDSAHRARVQSASSR